MQAKKLSERVAQWENMGSGGQQQILPQKPKVESPVRLFGAAEKRWKAAIKIQARFRGWRQHRKYQVMSAYSCLLFRWIIAILLQSLFPEKQHVYRTQVVEEILSTEKQYIKTLQLLIKVCLTCTTTTIVGINFLLFQKFKSTFWFHCAKQRGRSLLYRWMIYAPSFRLSKLWLPRTWNYLKEYKVGSQLGIPIKP